MFGTQANVNSVTKLKFKTQNYNNLFFRLSRIQRKVYIANKALHYFLTQTWIFKNDQFISLIDIIPDKDRYIHHKKEKCIISFY